MPYHCPEGEFKPVVTEYPYAENTGKTIPSRIQNKKRNCAFLTSQESKISQSGGKNIWKGELSVLHVETDRFLKIRRLRLQKNLVCAFVARCGPSFGGHSFVARTAPPLVARNCRRILEVSTRTHFGV